MGRNKSQLCPTCLKSVEVRRMKNHMAVHARAQAKLDESCKNHVAKEAKRHAKAQTILNLQTKKEADKKDKKLLAQQANKAKQQLIADAKRCNFALATLPLSITLWYICGHFDPKCLYHVIFKDEFKTPQDRLYFEDHWEVVQNLTCQCHGSNVMGSKKHTHMLARYSNREAIATFRRKLTGKMNGSQAAKFIPIFRKRPKYSSSILIQTYVHLMDTILYIQTESGTHKKFDHRFPHTLTGEHEKNLFLFNSLKEWKWSQVTYMKYCLNKIAMESSRLQNINDSKMQNGIIKRIDRLRKSYEKLFEKWGSPELFTITELEESLQEWLQFCKQTTKEHLKRFCKNQITITELEEELAARAGGGGHAAAAIAPVSLAAQAEEQVPAEI